MKSEEIERIVEDWAKDIPLSITARKMGLSRGQIYYQLKKLRLVG
jgi:DNA-binding Lrp family transcriptional regulator